MKTTTSSCNHVIMLILLLWVFRTLCNMNHLWLIHLCYALCLAFWMLFCSLVPKICSHASCGQVHGLLQSHCGDNWEGTFLFFCIVHWSCFCENWALWESLILYLIFLFVENSVKERHSTHFLLYQPLLIIYILIQINNFYLFTALIRLFLFYII